MKKFVKQLCFVGVLCAQPLFVFAQSGATFTAPVNVVLQVDRFASITGLATDIRLDSADITSGLPGAAGAVYQESVTFALESNAAVTISIEAPSGMLVNASTNAEVPLLADLNGGTDPINQTIGTTNYTLRVTATLGDISTQGAGDYAGSVVLTVAAQ
jgi:hypothetical protein